MWGRLFSILPWLPKYCPEWSEYNILRESAMKYYDCIKVRQKPSTWSLLNRESHFSSRTLQAIVDEQYASFGESHERHFMDKFFLKLENAKESADSSFNCK